MWTCDILSKIKSTTIIFLKKKKDKNLSTKSIKLHNCHDSIVNLECLVLKTTFWFNNYITSQISC